MFQRLLFLIFSVLATTVSGQPVGKPAEGYRGIWYFIGPTKNEYAYKYSGGLGTYPANHYPFSVYAPAVNKTFFCYGGVTDSTSRALCHMVGVFDHKTGMVSRPTLLLDKQTDDAHDNPVIQLDDQGYIWIFSTSHGTERPSFIHKSRAPYQIDAFDRIDATRLDKDGKTVPFNNFSYLQVYQQRGKGFLGLMTHYDRGMLLYGANKPRRTTAFITSPDGVTWSAWHDIGTIEEGHYQSSGQKGNKIGSAFNYHPNTKVGAGLDYRTNVYYVETDDMGKSWHTADGKPVSLPLADIANPALVQEYKSLGMNAYISDVNFDAANRPMILYITSKGPEPGPQSGPHTWHLAHWTGKAWEILPVATSDHNYDMGSLYVEGNTWRIIGTIGAGPQSYGTGGDLLLLESRDGGKSWKTTKTMTHDTTRNQGYPRRPVAVHPDFYAFWADGNARKPSASYLYFCNKAGEVFRLPAVMKSGAEKPVRVK